MLYPKITKSICYCIICLVCLSACTVDTSDTTNVELEVLRVTLLEKEQRLLELQNSAEQLSQEINSLYNEKKETEKQLAESNRSNEELIKSQNKIYTIADNKEHFYEVYNEMMFVVVRHMNNFVNYAEEELYIYRDNEPGYKLLEATSIDFFIQDNILYILQENQITRYTLQENTKELPLKEAVTFLDYMNIDLILSASDQYNIMEFMYDENEALLRQETLSTATRTYLYNNTKYLTFSTFVEADNKLLVTIAHNKRLIGLLEYSMNSNVHNVYFFKDPVHEFLFDKEKNLLYTSSYNKPILELDIYKKRLEKVTFSDENTYNLYKIPLSGAKIQPLEKAIASSIGHPFYMQKESIHNIQIYDFNEDYFISIFVE